MSVEHWCVGIHFAAALLTRESAVVVGSFQVAGASRVTLYIAVLVYLGLLGCSPCWDVEDCASECFQLEPLLLPLPCRLAGAVECAEPGINGALVGFGTKLRRRDWCDAGERTFDISYIAVRIATI